MGVALPCSSRVCRSCVKWKGIGHCASEDRMGLKMSNTASVFWKSRYWNNGHPDFEVRLLPSEVKS